jgi:hypothetical protein
MKLANQRQLQVSREEGDADWMVWCFDCRFKLFYLTRFEAYNQGMAHAWQTDRHRTFCRLMRVGDGEA